MLPDQEWWNTSKAVNPVVDEGPVWYESGKHHQLITGTLTHHQSKMTSELCLKLIHLNMSSQESPHNVQNRCLGPENDLT